MSEKPEAIRQDMVNTAVQFLQNQAVKSSAISQKRAFLIKKGLTQEEIEQAFTTAGAYQDENNRLAALKNQALTTAVSTYKPVQAPQSRWIRFGKFVGFVVVTGAAAHWLYTMYKKYILPKLLNLPTEEERLSRVEKELSEFRRTMGDSMIQLTASIAELSRAIHEQSKRMENHSLMEGRDQQSHNNSVSELTHEVLSLKGLLLGRKQFPSSPSVGIMANPTLGGLPTWQLPPQQKEHDGSGDSTPSTNGQKVNGKTESEDEEHQSDHSDDEYSSTNDNLVNGVSKSGAAQIEESNPAEVSNS